MSVRKSSSDISNGTCAAEILNHVSRLIRQTQYFIDDSDNSFLPDANFALSAKTCRVARSPSSKIQA
jgi:hypothetical protein